MSAVPRVTDSPAALIVNALNGIVEGADGVVVYIAHASYGEALEIYRAAGETGMAAYQIQCAACARLLTLAHETARARGFPIKIAEAEICRETGIDRKSLHEDAKVHDLGLLEGSSTNSGCAPTVSATTLSPTFYRRATHTPDPAAFVEEVARRQADDPTFSTDAARLLAKRYKALARDAAATDAIAQEDAGPLSYRWTLETSDDWMGAGTVDIEPAGLARLGWAVGDDVTVTIYADYVAIRRV